MSKKGALRWRTDRGGDGENGRGGVGGRLKVEGGGTSAGWSALTGFLGDQLAAFGATIGCGAEIVAALAAVVVGELTLLFSKCPNNPQIRTAVLDTYSSSERVTTVG
jgi:hypothetical protein